MLNIFTKKLKEVRKKKGYTQENLATLLDIGIPTYSRKENNLIPFTLEELGRIKEFLKLSDQDFVNIFFRDIVALKTTK